MNLLTNRLNCVEDRTLEILKSDQLVSTKCIHSSYINFIGFIDILFDWKTEFRGYRVEWIQS